MTKSRGLNKPEKLSLLQHMGLRLRVLLQDVVKTLHLQRIRSDQRKAAEGVNGANAPHCEANVLDAHGKITCSLSAPIQLPLSVIHGAQRLINLEIPVLVRSLKSSNVELG